MDPAFFVTNREAQDFFPFCAAQSSSNFHPWHLSLGFSAPARHRARPEESEQLVMLCQSGLSFPWKRKGSLHVSSTVLDVNAMSPGHLSTVIKGLQESEVKQDFPG